MHVEAINIGPSDAIGPVTSVRAVAGKGLEGDRYFFPGGAGPGEALTVIEAEVLEEVGLTGAQSRRQVMVRGVRVNDLVGKRFMIGEVECLGTELCEPCLHLQSLTRPGIIKALIHRAGLRADILSGGTISVGDQVLEGQYLPERIVEPLSGKPIGLRRLAALRAIAMNMPGEYQSGQSPARARGMTWSRMRSVSPHTRWPRR